MKKCSFCKSEIDDKATVCPYCRKNQPNAVAVIIVIVVLIFVFKGIFTKNNDIKKSSEQSKQESIQQTPKISPSIEPSTTVAPTKTTKNDTIKVSPTVVTESKSGDTLAQKNAVRKAKSYLDYSGFSRSGLIKQLEYEKFSHEDAVYGADNIGADWNKQAERKAKSYMDYSAFSRGSLISQLEYEGFTNEQAVYGVNAIGL